MLDQRPEIEGLNGIKGLLHDANRREGVVTFSAGIFQLEIGSAFRKLEVPLLCSNESPLVLSDDETVPLREKILSKAVDTRNKHSRRERSVNYVMCGFFVGRRPVN